MAFTSTPITDEPRAWSVGPLKMEVHTWSTENADTSGTVTAKSLERISAIIIDGLEQTAAPTLSGNTATLAFTDPGDDVFGTLILLGK